MSVMQRFWLSWLMGFMSVVGMNAHAENPLSAGANFASLYLDSKAHGYNDSDLDSFLTGLSLIYDFNDQVSVEAGYSRVLIHFNETTAFEEVSGGLWYSDLRLALSSKDIKPYLAFGVGEILLTPDSGNAQLVKRIGLGIDNPLTDRLTFSASYTQMTASVIGGKAETLTEFGLTYRFED